MIPIRLLIVDGEQQHELMAGAVKQDYLPGFLLAFDRLQNYIQNLRVEVNSQAAYRLDLFPGQPGEVRARVMARAAS